jgi:hypothetical protein
MQAFLVHPGFLWVQSQSAGLLRPGTRGIATPESTSGLDDLDQMNLFKMSGFLPSSEPAIGRSQELATVGWWRRTAELPLLVELERAACPQKSRKDRFFACGVLILLNGRHGLRCKADWGRRECAGKAGRSADPRQWRLWYSGTPVRA